MPGVHAPGLLPLVALANLCAMMTFGVISVAMPEITRSLEVPASRGIWVPDAFLVAVVCITPLSAYLVRRFDPRRLLSVALGGVAMTALVAAFAPDLPTLVALVFVHGLFAAPIAPVTQHLVASRLPSEQRGRGMAWWTGGTMAGGLLGGTLGGPLAEFTPYSLDLLLVLPLVVPTMVLLLRRESPLAKPAPVADRAPVSADFLGAGLLIAATLSLGLVLNMGDNVGWFAHPATSLLTLVFLVSAAVFMHHYRRTPRPILDFTPLRDAHFAAAALMIFGVNLVSTGQFETQMLGTMLGFNSGFLGLRAALGGAGLLLGVVLAGWLVGRTSAVAALGLAMGLLLVGKAGYLGYSGSVGWLAGLWPAIVSSMGFGLLASLLAALAFDRIAAPLTAAATACFVFAGQLGAAMGLAGLNALMSLVESAGDADGRWPFLLIFTLELIGAALLCLLLPVFRRGAGR